MRHLYLLVVAVFGYHGLAYSQTQLPCNWNPDYDGDNVIGVSDLLALLGVFEEVDSDGDGIFDSEDDCVGVIDVCGVCNGPGQSFPVVNEVIYLTDSVFLEPTGSWYVFSIPVDTLHTFVCPVEGCMDMAALNFNPAAVIENGTCTYAPPQCNGLSSVTFDGHTYNLVGIGEQCWFKENLRSDHYRNGDPIPDNLTNDQWANITAGAQAIYANETGNLDAYGRLYNGYAITDSRGLCPSGFHVPSDEEWRTLELGLGMSAAQSNSMGWRGTNEGHQLKASTLESPGWNGSNSSGFTALPGGARNDSNGQFGNLAEDGGWWSSSPIDSAMWLRYLGTAKLEIYRDLYLKNGGFSVRCILNSPNTSCWDPDNDGICAENEWVGCTDPMAPNFNPQATEDDGSCLSNVPCVNQHQLEYHGIIYQLQSVDGRCWFVNNLKTEQYTNGDSIPLILSPGGTSVWRDAHLAGIGARTHSQNDPENSNTFGFLYSGHAITDARGVCPSGWRVASDEDWKAAEQFAGMPENELDLLNAYRGTEFDISSDFKASPTSPLPWNGNNSLGLEILGGGAIHNDGYAILTLDAGLYWAPGNSNASSIHIRMFETNYAGIYRSSPSIGYGARVRCVFE